MSYLKLRLSGRMQYYWSETMFVASNCNGYYRTERHPTRSAISGLLGAAFGCSRGDEKIAWIRDTYEMKYRVLKSGSVGVDYQTVAPLTKDMKFSTPDGGTKSENIIKQTEYLQGYDFEVYIGGDEKLLQDIYEHILHPNWPLYLGKKAYLPMYPIVEDEFRLIDTLPKHTYDM